MKVVAFLLPDKMMIETLNKKDAGTWYSTGDCTILPLHASDVELGNCVLNHLKQSKEKDSSYDQIRENWKLMIKKAGFKTEKAFLQYVKRVSIIVDDRKMIFEPFKINIPKKTFYRLPDFIKEIEYIPENFEAIGKELKNSWSKCFSTS
ncbi:MAG TPA: hypothetical protein VHQ93_17105 [Chitinophagaceae bacterium]|jgi:hypothetical protein|nr:hypothetical protein [Chitinophagaceae bacterium]